MSRSERRCQVADSGASYRLRGVTPRGQALTLIPGLCTVHRGPGAVASGSLEFTAAYSGRQPPTSSWTPQLVSLLIHHLPSSRPPPQRYFRSHSDRCTACLPLVSLASSNRSVYHVLPHITTYRTRVSPRLQLTFYGAYHDHPVNVGIHMIFVPAILW